MRFLGLSAVLLGLTAMLYWPALGYPFVYEDLNDGARFARPLFDRSTFAAGNPARVLTELSTEVGRLLCGDGPAGQHGINLGLHLVNVLLVGVLAWGVLPPLGALVAAALFAVHPVQVEAVAYVSGRSDLLAAGGVLLALCATSAGSLSGAFCGLALSALSKEAALVAWGLVPMWALVTRAPFPIRRFCAMAVAVAAAGAGLVVASIRDLSFGVDLELMGRTAWSVVRLALLAVVPLGQTIDHDWSGAALWLQSLSVGVWVALTTWALLALWRASAVRWLALAWLTWAWWTLPRFVVPSHEGLHEHHLVMPLVFVALSVGAWYSSIPERSR